MRQRFDPGETVSPGFRFHLAIALATGNRYFADLMGQLGPAVIPRTRVSATWLDPEQRLRHLQKVHREHEQIYEAIVRQDAESARAAMRIHLTNSRETAASGRETCSLQKAHRSADFPLLLNRAT